jgi:phage terminase large subunit
VAGREVTIQYAPRLAFLPFHNRLERWGIMVAHRRAGKTVACINDLIRRATMCPYPYGRYAYVAPYLAQAKEVAWAYLTRYAQPITVDKNEGELWVELPNGARIRIHGADNPDRLRGAYLDGLILDEYADMRPSVWGEVIRPMLADRKGWATFIGTPKGRNEFHKLWVEAEWRPGWFRLMLKASESGILDEEELQSNRETQTPEQYSQEFECSFDAAILGAYYGRDIAELERKGQIGFVPPVEGFPVHSAWDLGKGQNMPVWCFQILGDELRIVDYIQYYDATIERLAADLDERGYHGIDFVPHDAKAPSLETGRTRVETLFRLKRKPQVVDDHKVDDGINAVRLTLKHCWFDSAKCAEGIEALRQYKADYDEKNRTFRDAPLHNWASHPADAFRYLAMGWRQVVPPPIPKPKPDFKPLPQLTHDEFFEATNQTQAKRERI